MIIRPAEIKVTPNWLKIGLGHDYHDKSGVKGSLYLPIADAKKILDRGSFTVSLNNQTPGDFVTTKLRPSDNFEKYVLNGVGNDYSKLYVAKEISDDLLEIDLMVG
jgi:hypothetical protein